MYNTLDGNLSVDIMPHCRWACVEIVGSLCRFCRWVSPANFCHGAKRRPLWIVFGLDGGTKEVKQMGYVKNQKITEVRTKQNKGLVKGNWCDMNQRVAV